MVTRWSGLWCNTCSPSRDYETFVPIQEVAKQKWKPLHFPSGYPLSIPCSHENVSSPFSLSLSLSLTTGGVMYQYFVKIVPTVYKNISGSVSHSLLEQCQQEIMWLSCDSAQVLQTNQFSVTKHKKISRAQHGDSGLPGALIHTSPDVLWESVEKCLQCLAVHTHRPVNKMSWQNVANCFQTSETPITIMSGVLLGCIPKLLTCYFPY